MSTPAQRHRPRSIINTYDQLTAAANAGMDRRLLLSIGRGEHSFAHVYSPFFDTDPAAAWYDYKKKVFYGDGGSGAQKRWVSARAQAIAWVAEKYGYKGEWAGNRMRDLVPAEVQKRFPIPKRT